MKSHAHLPKLLLCGWSCLLLSPLCRAAGDELSYERDVRPLLKTHCFHCHGEGDELEGGLDLRLHRLLAKGGDSGPAVVAGAPARSLLLQRLQSGEMPPPEVSLRPTEADIATIARWIAGGAVTKHAEPDNLDPGDYITEEERSYWAFQPIRRSLPPPVHDDDRVATPIDQFVLARLEEHELTLAAEADRRTLVRRLYFDLLGLPPTPEEVEAFLADDSPAAYERLLDRLLSSPHYGERWGRHWLDVAGYADSEGYTDDDPLRPEAYKYRDYVIGAFNSDQPFDQFVIEQLAGDELLTPPLTNLSPEAAEKLIATGFLRTAPDGTGSGSVDQSTARNEVVAKTIEIVSTSLLGLTVGCAQCHNHRYDPISQADYYALRAVFEPALNWKAWLQPDERRISLYTETDRQQAAAVEAEAQQVLAERTKKQEEFIQATFERELAKLQDHLREPIRLARQTPAKERTAEQQKLLKDHPSVNVSAGSLYLYDAKAAEELKKLQDQAEAIRGRKPKEEFVRAVWEPAGQEAPKTFLFHRGDHEQAKQELLPAELPVLAARMSAPLPANDPAVPTSGRRLAYAKWLVSGQHPLVARVVVNRIWLHHFGQGLVPTPGDFGALGSPPTHPELLDWLASEFMDSGWSVKHVHRLILSSTTYRQSSAGSDADLGLSSRMPLRRLDAESLRDALLAVSGELNWEAGGPAVPVMADTVGQFVIGKENLDAGRPGEVLDMRGQPFRRSVYVQVRRSRPLSVLAPFDLPRMEPNCTARASSTVSPQSLLLMNSDFVVGRAEQLAQRAQREAGDGLSEQIQRVWQIVFSTPPTEGELAEALGFVAEQEQHFATRPAPDAKQASKLSPRQEALASFCHVLLSSNRFLYID